MSTDKNSKGLDDIVVTSSELTLIDGSSGKLSYRGYDISNLTSNCSFEEVIFLLWHGSLPSINELDNFKAKINQNRNIPPQLISLIRQSPKESSTMDLLRTCVSYLSSFDSDLLDTSSDSRMNASIKLLAKIPTILCYSERIRHNQELIEPNPDLDIAANFLYMLKGKLPDDSFTRIFDQCLIIHADHGLNASTFAARVTASTLSDVYSAITSAIGTLKGPLHGGANEAVMIMLNEIKKPENAQNYILDKLKKKDRIMGFGHRVYKTIDPRAVILCNMSKQLQSDYGGVLYDISMEIENIMDREKNLKPNVDFYAASVYTMLNIPSHLFTPIFAVSRISGWCAQILEQYVDNRLIRPRANYIGYKSRTFIPLKDR